VQTRDFKQATSNTLRQNKTQVKIPAKSGNCVQQGIMGSRNAVLEK